MKWRREAGLVNRTPRISELPIDRAEHVRARARARYRKNPDRCKKDTALYRQRHPERVRTRNIHQKTRRIGAPGRHTTSQWLNVLQSYRGLCVYCLGPATQRDHVVPIVRGGSNDIENIAPTCGHCNSSKNDTPLLMWMVRRGW